MRHSTARRWPFARRFTAENSSELISTVEGLANLYSAELNLIAAEPLYLRLLALWESAVGKDHPMVAVTLDKLVVFYVKEGQPEKAREALARSVAIRAHFLAVGLSLQADDAMSENHREQATALIQPSSGGPGTAGSSKRRIHRGDQESARRDPVGSPPSARQFVNQAAKSARMNCFHPFAAREAQPQAAAFAIDVHVDIEEGAAQAFTLHPFRNQLKGGRVGRKFELEAIAQFVNAFLAGSQRGAQFIKMPFAGLGRESRAVAGKGGFGGMRRQAAGHEQGQSKRSFMLTSG